MQRALFFCFLFGISPFYTTWRTEHASLLHDTAGRWMRGGPGAEGEAPDMSSGSQEGQIKWNQKQRQKVGESRTCVRHIAIGTRFVFFVMFFRHHRHCRLELRGVDVQKYLYGRSALSRSNVNVP
jgi:hypothetical protein